MSDYRKIIFTRHPKVTSGRVIYSSFCVKAEEDLAKVSNFKGLNMLPTKFSNTTNRWTDIRTNHKDLRPRCCSRRKFSATHLPIPSGSLSRLFWERQRSVRLERPEISSGMYSSTFSDTSSWVSFFRLPISWKWAKCEVIRCCPTFQK